MKRIHFGLAGVMVCLACCMAIAQPKLEAVQGLTFNLGTISRGMVMTHQVTLKNAGTEVLHLGPIEASCGCTGAVASEESLRPSTSTTLTITFNSKNFTGQVHKTVTVKTTPAIDPPMVIEFTATVIDEITVQPSQLWYKDAEVGRMSSRTVTVTNNGKEPLKLTAWHSGLAGLVLKLPAGAIEPGKSADIVAEFTPEKVNSILSEAAFVTTSNPNRPELFLPVYGNAKEFKFQ
jgi:hypothetical protein